MTMKMNIVRLCVKIYVRYWRLGDSRLERCRNRNVSALKLKLRKHEYGFDFFDIVSAIVVVDGRKVKLQSHPLQVSPMHYVDATIYTADEIRQQFPDKNSLLDNVNSRGYTKWIRTRSDNWFLFQAKAVLVTRK